MRKTGQNHKSIINITCVYHLQINHKITQEISRGARHLKKIPEAPLLVRTRRIFTKNIRMSLHMCVIWNIFVNYVFQKRKKKGRQSFQHIQNLPYICFAGKRIPGLPKQTAVDYCLISNGKMLDCAWLGQELSKISNLCKRNIF